MPPVPLGDRNPHAAGDEDVLTLAERHLHLRHDVPLDQTSPFQLAHASELEHRRPAAAEPALHHRGADHATPEHFVRMLAATRNLGPDLRLHERVAAQYLPDREERLELHHSAAKAFGFLARRQHDLAADAENRATTH